MAQKSLLDNIERIKDVRDTILTSLRARGDIEVPDDARLSNLPALVDQVSIKRITIRTAEEGLTKGGSIGLRMAICSDVHIKGDGTAAADVRMNTLMARLGSQYASGELDVVICLGDLIGPEAPSYADYVAIKQDVDNWKELLNGCPIYFVPGNHDTYEKGDDGLTAWSKVTGQTAALMNGPSEKVFRVDMKGEVLLFYGGYGKRWSAKDSINTAEERQWIRAQLDECSDMGRVWMLTHFYYPLDGFGYRCTSGSSYMDNSGDSYDTLRVYEGIAKTYKNLIWVSGHGHTSWEKEQQYPTIKAHSNESARLIGCPSLMQPDNNQYAYVKCYQDMALIEGMNNADGTKVASATYFLPKAAESEIQYWSVTQNLTGLTSTFDGSRVADGSRLELTLSLEEGYSDPEVRVSVGGQDVTATAYDSSTGKVVISQVSGNVVIEARATLEGFYTISTVLRGYGYDGPQRVTEGGSLQASLSLQSGWAAGTITITMGGQDITASALSGNVISIQQVTGDVVVTAQAKAIYTITCEKDEGITITIAGGQTSIAEGETLYAMVEGEDMTVTVTMGGQDITDTAYAESSGHIYITNVTGNVTITARSNKADWSDWVELELDVEDASQPVTVFASVKYVSDVFVDEVAASPATTYQFSSSGRHKVHFKSTDGTFHTGLLSNCECLYSIKPPAGLTAITAGGSNPAFKSKKLAKAELLGLATLAAYTFYGCTALAEVSLNVGEIKNSSMHDCTAISTLRFLSAAAPVVGSSAFDDFEGQAGTVYYPQGSDYNSVKNLLPGWTFVGE